MTEQVLLLPGWYNSGAAHWQSHWETRYGDQRVQQADWDAPVKTDWIATLENAVADASGPVLLAAHSLGCVLVAAWAAQRGLTHKVRGALLVAPGDVEQADIAAGLPGWGAVPMQALPFAAHLIISSNDPYCSLARAQAMGMAWGVRVTLLGAVGHINSDSGLGDWPQGRQWLDELRLA
jgi:predicted alpha/beta hydrolase family esterase